MERPRIFRFFIIAAACLVVCMLLTLFLVRSRGVSIPLSSIISTSGQGELQATTAGYRMVDGEKQYVVPTGEALQHFFDMTKGNAASNVFLVDAPNDVSAMAVSSTVFAGYRSAEYPAVLNKPNPPRGNHWLVVFVGVAGSSPVSWIVDNVTVNDGKIRFGYHRNPIGASSLDIHYYYYWVPLGKLDDGIYSLELYDTKLKAVTLMRRVEILTPRRRRLQAT